MLGFRKSARSNQLFPFQRATIIRKFTLLWAAALLLTFLAACGSAVTATGSLSPTPTPTATVAPTATPTPSPTATPSPTPKPKPTPKPTPKPLVPPVNRPAPILDVAPASMSIVGHLDCHKTSTVYVCQAAVISRGSNQLPLTYVAYANIGGVSMFPARGSVAPGTRVILTIRIPIHECAGTFFFQGPINTHTIGWQC